MKMKRVAPGLYFVLFLTIVVGFLWLAFHPSHSDPKHQNEGRGKR
jgi:hypothetical protein